MSEGCNCVPGQGENYPRLIMKVNEWKGKKYTTAVYRCGCSCGEPSHDVYIEVEYDKDFNQLSLMFYKDVYFFDREQRDVILNFWHCLKRQGIGYMVDQYVGIPLRNLWYRLKKATRLIFTGYLEMNESFLFDDEEHINNFLCAIQQGRYYVLKEGKE